MIARPAWPVSSARMVPLLGGIIDGRFLAAGGRGTRSGTQARSRRAGVLRKRDVEYRRMGDVSAGVIE